MTRKLLFIFLLALPLTGCSTLKSPGGRVVLLVLLPAVIIFAALWLLRRRDAGKGQGRGPRFPDYDDRD